MPSYEDQLAAYRAQLANISSSSAATSVPGSGAMATAGLAFNTAMSDLARVASYVHNTPSVPAAYGIPNYSSGAYNMGFGEAMWASAGYGMPPSPMHLEDYRYMASQKVSSSVGDATISLSAGAVGVGTGILASAATGALIGSVVPGVGTVVGGIAGAVVGAAVSMASSSALTAQAMTIRNTAKSIRSVTPGIFGGMGLSVGAATDIAKFVNRQSISNSDGILGSPSDQIDLYNLAIGSGSKYGLFSGATDADSFKRELGEMTRVIKEVSNSLRMAREEVVPLLAEMRQGGFYGSASAQMGINAGSGMAYGAGVTFNAMHEAGLRGAAVFRGTGIPTQFGYQMGQTGLFQAKRMQQLGIVSQEAVNQLGGISGMAESINQSTAMFMQGPMGRATMAMLMQGDGGINMSAMGQMMHSGNPMSAANFAMMDPTATLNPMNVSRFWGNMGPERTQQVQAAWLNSYAKMFQNQYDISYERGFGLAMQYVAPMMGVAPNAENQEMLMGLARRLPQLERDQRAAVYEGNRRAAYDAYERKYDFWEDTKVRNVGRGFRRMWTPVGESISDLGSGAGNVARNVGDFVMNRDRITTNASDISEFLSRDPNLMSRSSGGKGVATRQDFELLDYMGETGYGGTYEYSPTRTEYVGRAIEFAATGRLQLTSGFGTAAKNALDDSVRLLRSYGGTEVSSEKEAEILKLIDPVVNQGSSQDRKEMAQRVQAGSQDVDVKSDVIKSSRSALKAVRAADPQGKKYTDEEVTAVLMKKRYAASSDSVQKVVGDLGGSSMVTVDSAKKEVKKTREDLADLGLTSDTFGEWGAYSDEAEAALNKKEVAFALEDLATGKISEAEFHKRTNNMFDISDFMKNLHSDKHDEVVAAAQAHRQAAGTLSVAEASPAVFSKMDLGVYGDMRKTSLGQAINSAAKGDKKAAENLVLSAMEDPNFSKTYAGAEGVMGDAVAALETRRDLASQLGKISGTTPADIKRKQELLEEAGIKGAEDLSKNKWGQKDWNKYLSSEYLASVQVGTPAGETESGNASERLSMQAAAYMTPAARASAAQTQQTEINKQILSSLQKLNESIDQKANKPGQRG